MALTHRADTVIKNLAKRGDTFAKHIIGKATDRDFLLTQSWAKRGDAQALRHTKGASAPVMARALVNRLAWFGDFISQGLNTLSVDRAAQTITFGQPADVELVDAETPSVVTLSATSSSGLPVSFVVVSGPATVSGASLTITAEGSVVVSARQAGSPNYAAATPVQRTITVTLPL